MTATTARLRQSAVVIVDCAIPEGMTISEYRRSRRQQAEAEGENARRARGFRRRRATRGTRD